MKTTNNSPFSPEYIQALLTHLFVLLPVAPDLTSLTCQIAAFMPEWYLQKQSHKNQFTFGVSGGYSGTNELGRRDVKETLHISLSYKPPPDAVLSSIDRVLISKVKEFLREGKRYFRRSLQLLEVATKTPGLTRQVMASYDQWTVRLLYYHPGNKHELLAKPHADRGFATWVFYESITGHQNLPLNKEGWRTMSIHEKNEPPLVIFQGGLTAQLLTTCRLPAVCHQVVNSDLASKLGRYSIVVFADLVKIALNKKKIIEMGIGTSAHDLFPLGSNYDYGPERIAEFSEWFTEEPQI